MTTTETSTGVLSILHNVQTMDARRDDEILRRIRAARDRMPTSGLWPEDGPVVSPETADVPAPGAYRRPFL